MLHLYYTSVLYCIVLYNIILLYCYIVYYYIVLLYYIVISYSIIILYCYIVLYYILGCPQARRHRLRRRAEPARALVKTKKGGMKKGGEKAASKATRAQQKGTLSVIPPF